MGALRKFSPGRPPLTGAERVARHRAKPRAIVAGEDQIVAEICERVKAPGSSKRVAHELGLSRAHLLSIANGTAAPGRKVAGKLGYELRYVRVLEQARAEELELAAKIQAELDTPSLLREGERADD